MMRSLGVIIEMTPQNSGSYAVEYQVRVAEDRPLTNQERFDLARSIAAIAAKVMPGASDLLPGLGAFFTRKGEA